MGEIVRLRDNTQTQIETAIRKIAPFLDEANMSSKADYVILKGLEGSIYGSYSMRVFRRPLRCTNKRKKV